MESFLQEGFLGSVQHPLVLVLLIILSSYVLEDAAIVFAALLSADGLVGSELAFLALFLGIFTGDLGLYAIGTQLQRFRWLSNRLDLDLVDKARAWLEQTMVTTVLLVRLVPGLRLPVYTACGFFRLPLLQFLILVLLASVIWTGAVFYGFYWVGVMFWADLPVWKWLLVPLIVFLVIFGQKRIKVMERFYK